MPLASLLLFSMVLAAPLGQLPAAQPSALDHGTYLTTGSAATPAQSFQLSPSQPAVDNLKAPSEIVCYKIRAYIFKRDDDHAPVFVRSTTCGPGTPRAEDAVWPKAKMVPAN